MTVTRFRTHAAIAASGAAVVAALGIAVAPSAYADEEWGAIAVSPDGKSIGVSTNQPNEYQANVAANSDCHQTNCNVLITFKSPDCGAVVKNGDQYFGDSGATQQEAEQNAMNQSPGSTVLRSACNNPPAGASTTTPTTTSTTPAGG
jgi:hypothetical protein